MCSKAYKMSKNLKNKFEVWTATIRSVKSCHLFHKVLYCFYIWLRLCLKWPWCCSCSLKLEEYCSFWQKPLCDCKGKCSLYSIKYIFLPFQKLTKLGQFRVKDESPSSTSSLQPGSLFFNRENADKNSNALKGKAIYLNWPAIKACFSSFRSL